MLYSEFKDRFKRDQKKQTVFIPVPGPALPVPEAPVYSLVIGPKWRVPAVIVAPSPLVHSERLAVASWLASTPRGRGASD
jgi:hypothetical protein